MDALVTRVMPCIRAFPDLVALASLSTELGEVKICFERLIVDRISSLHDHKPHLLALTNKRTLQ